MFFERFISFKLNSSRLYLPNYSYNLVKFVYFLKMFWSRAREVGIDFHSIS